MKNDLTILMVWFKETNPDRIKCFEENRKSLIEYNPGVEVITIMNPFEKLKEAWLNTDLTIFLWYKENCDKIKSERFLLLEWDCWCDINLKEYFSNAWNFDVVAPSILYPERDDWYWFKSITKLPPATRLFATGIAPFCGILVSEKAMRAICKEILKPDYNGLIGELRFATIATMLGFDPVPNPVVSRAITWKLPVPFNQSYRGLHHPRKTLPAPNVLNEIENKLNLDKDQLPRIIHQTWKDETVPEHLIEVIETWKTIHPDWEYILWTDEMNSEFIRRFFPEFLLQYDSYQHTIQRVDAVRYFILYKIGGVFIDLDFECLENIEPLLVEAECVFGLEPTAHCEKFHKEKIISNAFMASKPGNDFFKVICNSLSVYYSWSQKFFNHVLSTTGAFALTDIYDKYEKQDEIRLLPSHSIYPFTVNEAKLAIEGKIANELKEKINKAYAVHYFLRSWY